MNLSRHLVVALIGISVLTRIICAHEVEPELAFPTNYKSGVLYNSIDREDRKEIHQRKETGVIQYEVGSRQATVPAATDAV